MSMNFRAVETVNQQIKTQKMKVNLETKKSGEYSALEKFQEEVLSAKFLNPQKKTPSSQKIRRRLAAIRRKVYSGGKLTPADKQFLKKYAPALYRQLVAVEQERERIERDQKRREFQQRMEELEEQELEKIAEDQKKEKKEIQLTYSKKIKKEELLKELDEEAVEEEQEEAFIEKEEIKRSFALGRIAYEAALKTEDQQNQCSRKA